MLKHRISTYPNRNNYCLNSFNSFNSLTPNNKNQLPKNHFLPKSAGTSPHFFVSHLMMGFL